ncbi:hypothetical protein [Haloferax volcanii]|uniref:Uncharacterized protein n=1 Tax=Haloferax volcanii TaxID=2246 RepID=A0A558G9W5_HALVO|nr:hypothetical protein [Haloferax volcanii]TVT94547.1 hypothetical protein FQA18_11340 [Haloferax volcanii]
MSTPDQGRRKARFNKEFRGSDSISNSGDIDDFFSDDIESGQISAEHSRKFSNIKAEIADRRDFDILSQSELEIFSEQVVTNHNRLERKISTTNSDVDLLTQEFNELHQDVQKNTTEISELSDEFSQFSEDQLSLSDISREIDVGLHVPIIVGISIVSAILSVVLALSGSVFSAVMALLSIFGYLNWRKMKNKYNLNLIDVI